MATKVKPYLKDNGDTVVVTLKKGYQPLGTNSRVQEVTVREPMVIDQLAARRQGNGDDAETEMALIAAVTGLAPDEIMSLSLNDYTRVQEGFSFFID